MRFLMKIAIPLTAEGPALEGKLQDIYRQLGALANYSASEDGRRVAYVLLELTPDKITPAAEPVFRLLSVKPEFLPEVVPRPYYGRRGY